MKHILILLTMTQCLFLFSQNSKWTNKEHKLTMEFPSNYEDVEKPENVLAWKYNFENNSSFEVTYSDDYVFSLFDMDDYREEWSGNKEAQKNALSVLYKDISINIWESEYLINDGLVVHGVYSGTLIEENIRRTVATIQFLKNNKLYTVMCSCNPQEFKTFYKKCRDVYDSISFF